MRCRSTEKQPQQGNTPDPAIRYLLTTSHLPFLTLKIVSSPFVKSPFLSNSMSAVTPGYLIFASAGRYFAGSLESAAFIVGRSTYEEVTIFFLDRPDALPQPIAK